MVDVTSILVKKSTRKKLMEVGKKGDTYDSIINKLLEENGRKQ